MVSTPIGTLERIDHDFWYCDSCDREIQCEHRHTDVDGDIQQCPDTAEFWVTRPYAEPGSLTRMRYCPEHTLASLEEVVDG
jgi:hypothetical protein